MGMVDTGAIVVSLVLMAASDPQTSNSTSDWKKVEGKWYLQRAVIDGKVANELAFDQRILAFKDDHLKCFLSHNPKGLQVQFDASTTPNSIDLVDVATFFSKEGDTKEEKTVTRGIYRFDGEDLVLCFAAPGAKQRPTAFDSKAGSKLTTLTITRKMPAEDSDEVIKHDLLVIGIWYFSQESQAGKSPANLEEVKPFIDENHEETAQRVKKGAYVVIWNADFNSVRARAPRGKSIAELGKYILAYEAKVPEKGGWVLTGDFGKPRKMTAKEFNAFPKIPIAK
jgi:uncharacterized protein (TIGR03067 family)